MTEDEPNSNPERIDKVINTKDDAVNFVKGFWNTLDPELIEGISDDELSEEITGRTTTDRTIVRRGVPSRAEERGKWVVVIVGNHNPLSDQAIEYLNNLDDKSES